MLTLSNVVTHYGHSQVLNGINLTIKEGQVATLLGRNGMGKTTTINSIMGILPKTSGAVEFDGQNTTHWPSHWVAKLGLGLVPEGRQIFPNLNVHENLIATARQHAQRGQIWDAERVYALFPELATRKSSMGNLLSGGEQQMLAIARALMTNPKLLILDEATEGLAPLIRKKIWESLELIKADGMSILIVDKNLKDLLQIA
ncbi:MAG: ABC transporter ATP-binding protein, partial [Rhodobacteraceae bacterium]|nr:ABC transporter ATP-binding protein [Paracoccaceae bacterium]